MAENKIGKYDIFTNESIATIDLVQASLKETLDVMKELAASGVQLSAAFRMPQGLEQTVQLTQRAAQNNSALEVTARTLEQQQNRLIQAQAREVASRTEMNASIVRTTAVTAENNKIAKLQAIINDQNTGSLERATAQNNLLQIEKRKLNLETEAGRQRLLEINQAQDENNRLIEESGNEMQKQKINIGNYQSAFGGLVDQFKNGEIGLKAFVSGIGKMGLALISNPIFLIAGAIAAIGAGVKAAVQQAEEYQVANAQLAGVLAITRAETMDLQKESQRLGATTAFSALEVAKLQTEYARLGFSKEQIMGVTGATIELSIAAGVAANDTAEFVGAAVNQFKLTTQEAQRVADVAAMGYSTTALSFEKLAIGFEKSAPAARAFGDSIEATTAKLGVLSNAGIGAEVAGTALKGMYLELASSGMTWDEAMGKIQGSTNKLKTANELFGKNFAVTALTLAENANQVKDLTVAYENAKGSAKALADEQLNTIEGSKTLLKSAWSGFLFAIEDGNGVISEMWKGFLDGVTAAISGITNFMAKTKAFFTSFYNDSMALRGGLAGLELTFKSVFAAIGLIIEEVFSPLLLVGKIIKAALTGDFEAIPKIFNENLKKTKENITQTVGKIGKDAKDALDQTINGKIIVDVVPSNGKAKELTPDPKLPIEPSSTEDEIQNQIDLVEKQNKIAVSLALEKKKTNEKIVENQKETSGIIVGIEADEKNALNKLDAEFLAEMQKTNEENKKQAEQNVEDAIQSYEEFFESQKLLLTENKGLFSANASERLAAEQELASKTLDLQKKLLEDQIASGLLGKDEMIAAKMELYDINKTIHDQEIAQITDQLDMRKKMNGEILGMVGQGFSVISGVYDVQAQRLEANYQKEIAGTEEGSAARIKAEKKYEAEKKKIARKQAITEKAQGLFNVSVTTAQAIMKALVDYPGPIGIAMSIMYGAMGVAQAATILAKPLPAFKSGGIVQTDTLARVSEQGNELLYFPDGTKALSPATESIMHLPKGTEVIPHDETMKLLAREAYVSASIEMTGTNKILQKIHDKPNEYVSDGYVYITKFNKKGRYKL